MVYIMVRKIMVYFMVLIIIVFSNNKAIASKYQEKEKKLDLHASSAVLIDAYTGRVLYGKAADKVLPMASTTKIMTCILTIENADLNDIVEISPYAASMPEVKLHMNAGDKYILKDLLYSLMLESHNDSAVAIAEYIASKKIINSKKTAVERSKEESKKLVDVFCNAMTEKAKEIGCYNTCYLTPNGLDMKKIKKDISGKEHTLTHSTTAKELAMVMQYCIIKSPKADEFIKICRTKEINFTDCNQKNSHSCINHNRYLDMNKWAICGKTGFTGKAGYCYIGAVKKDGVYLIAAILGCGWPPEKTLKWKDMNLLTDYGFLKYKCVEAGKEQKVKFSYAVSERNNKGIIKGWKKKESYINMHKFKMLMSKSEHIKWYKFMLLEDNKLKTGIGYEILEE